MSRPFEDLLIGRAHESRVSDKSEDEDARCCFCMELKKGLTVLVYLFLGSAILELLVMPWFVTTEEWAVFTAGMKILYIINDLYSFATFCVGAMAVQKRKPDLIYTFFLLCVFGCALQALGFIITSFEYGAGHLGTTFVAICVQKHKGDESSHKTCEEEAKGEAFMELAGYPLYLAFQGYLAYIVRKFYIIVIKENNGYNRYEGLGEVDAVV